MKNEIPDIQWAIKRRASKHTDTSREMFPVEVSRASRKFHRQIPGYTMSPLRALPNLAQMFGVGGIWVKDESVRLELNSCSEHTSDAGVSTPALSVITLI